MLLAAGTTIVLVILPFWTSFFFPCMSSGFLNFQLKKLQLKLVLPLVAGCLFSEQQARQR
jgi:hypothetical protein